MFNGKTYYKWPFSVALFLIFSASNRGRSQPRSAQGLGREPHGAPGDAGRVLRGAAAAGAGQRQPGALRRDARLIRPARLRGAAERGMVGRLKTVEHRRSPTSTTSLKVMHFLEHLSS